MSKGYSKSNRRVRDFLREYFFNGVDKYSTKDAGNYVLEHRWNGNRNEWEVAIFTKESFAKMQKGKTRHFEQQEQFNHIQDIARYG